MAPSIDFVGKLVEIHGCTAALEEEDYLRDAGAHEPLIPNGKIGRAMAFDTSLGKFAVEIFDGFLLSIAPDHLKEYKPPASEVGGFDVTWPADEREFLGFAPQVMESLRQKDYCKVQMYMSDMQCSRAMEEGKGLRFTRMQSELDLAYLGRNSESKICWMPGVTDPELEIHSALQLCDHLLATFCKFIHPLTAPALDFTAECQTNCMVRMPLTEPSGRRESISQDDIEEGVVDSHISFCRRRKLCMMMVVESSGSDLTLIPQDPEKPKVHVGVEKGQLIVFNHAQFSYEYKPSSSEDMILQSWVLAAPPATLVEAVHADQGAKDAAIGLFDGPKTPAAGNRVCIMSWIPGQPGGAHDNADTWWALLAPGTDAYVKAPMSRFDIDPYFRPNETWELGWTYAIHAGFVTEDIYAFDNKYFNVPEDEAMICNPNIRKLFERGYSCLHASGFKKDTLRSANVGTYVGNSTDDWNGQPQFTFGSEDCHRSGLVHRSVSQCYQQIPYTFGMKGPAWWVDTACSSALVAYNVAHTAIRQPENQQIRSGCDQALTDALVMGTNLIPGPGAFVGLSGPHMLSPTGRCFTFDHSADGFARGEGTGAFLAKSLTFVSDDSLAVVIGACTNQDGRSASLTAPNGPSQSACIRKSMQEAGNTPNEITCAECHGTGTALGDPIEVGALRGIMQDRELPLMETSAKAHIGHLEACAGLAGVLKCICMNQSCCGSPSPHLGELNPNLDINGYPTIFCTEMVPYGGNSGNTGVSSFGWGGANARADVWATCFRGANKVDRSAAHLASKYVDYMEATCPVDDGPIYYLDGTAVPSEFSNKFFAGKRNANAIRDEFDSYNCSVYSGEYQLAPDDDEVPLQPAGGPVCVVGTWTAYTQVQEMSFDDESDVYSFTIALGETRCEQFQIVMMQGSQKMNVYPVINQGSMHTRVLGPDNTGNSNSWLLDGRDEEVPAGTIYKICLHWGPKLKVSWERQIEADASLTALGTFSHSYQVLGTFTAWTPQSLTPVAGENGFYEAKIKITGKESFQFMRDFDASQRIYPSSPQAADASIPVRGPDAMGEGKKFYIEPARSQMKEEAILRLGVRDGHVTVVVQQQSKTIMWESVEGPGRHSYSVKGSWNNSDLMPMTPDLANPGVYTCQGVMQSMEEFFTIVVDSDARFQLYPEMLAAPGKCICKGPDGGSKDRMWQMIALKPRVSFEIKLDFTAINKRDRVTLRWLTDPVDIPSMQSYINQYYDLSAMRL
mmetsp:Transcript_136843/g.248869  ORF Transcript_136843/g.248869 Transcript_136843/m.248869 type:complete len:1243 (+) Transcript_136843:54-3782(+)